MNKKKTKKIAFCGILASLSLVLMFSTTFVPIASFAIPALSGCVLIAVVTETNVKWGFGVYAVVAVLSILIVPDREAALFYIAFAGYYPVLYAVLGRIKNKKLRMLAKLAVFNAAMAVQAFISIKVLNIPVEEAAIFGKYTIIIMLAVLNAVFIVYDRSMDGLIVWYINVIRPKVRGVFKI